MRYIVLTLLLLTIPWVTAVDIHSLNNIRFYGSLTGEAPNIEFSDVGYLFEGQKVKFDIKTSQAANLRIFTSSGNSISDFNPKSGNHYEGVYTVNTIVEHGWDEVKVEAESGGSKDTAVLGTWFLNPDFGLNVPDGIDVVYIPGGTAYSNEKRITSWSEYGAHVGSPGMFQDLFISGTDFYDETLQGACPDTIEAKLSYISYHARIGSKSTANDPRADAQGYVPIQYGIGFNDPNPFGYDHYLILDGSGNPIEINENDELYVKFRIRFPAGCHSTYDVGAIYLWGLSNKEFSRGYGFDLDMVNSCATRSYKGCSSGDLHWYNSCGNREGMAQSCSSGCQDGACVQSSCSDGIRNGNEKGVDCGGSCNKCYDIVFFPVEWAGNYDFEDEVRRHVQNMESLLIIQTDWLDDKKLNPIILDKECENKGIIEWSFLRNLKKCAKTKLKYGEAYVGISDQNLWGRSFTIINSDMIFIDGTQNSINDPYVLLHEFGHSHLGLCDEYGHDAWFKAHSQPWISCPNVFPTYCNKCQSDGCCAGSDVDWNSDGIPEGKSIMGTGLSGFGNMGESLPGFNHILDKINLMDPELLKMTLEINKSGGVRIVNSYVDPSGLYSPSSGSITVRAIGDDISEVGVTPVFMIMSDPPVETDVTLVDVSMLYDPSVETIQIIENDTLLLEVPAIRGVPDFDEDGIPDDVDESLNGNSPGEIPEFTAVGLIFLVLAVVLYIFRRR